MGCQIGALPCTPFAASRDFAPVGSMSLDSRVASLPYESSSLATSRGNEKIGGTGYCVTYDTDSQSRNVLASPLGEEGHEVAKGCTRVRSKNDTGRRLAVRTAMGCQIGALPRTPFASSRRSPQGETRSMERKNRESYISCTIPQFPPLVANAVSQSPECVSCHMIQKANLVTLTLYSSPKGRYHNPRGQGPRQT